MRATVTICQRRHPTLIARSVLCKSRSKRLPCNPVYIGNSENKYIYKASCLLTGVTLLGMAQRPAGADLTGEDRLHNLFKYLTARQNPDDPVRFL